MILTYHREQRLSVEEQSCLDVMAMAGVQAVQQVCRSCIELTFLQGALTNVECLLTSLDLGKMSARRSYASKRYDLHQASALVDQLPYASQEAPYQPSTVSINACYGNQMDGNS